MKHSLFIYKIAKRRYQPQGPMDQIFLGDRSLPFVLVDPVDLGLQ